MSLNMLGSIERPVTAQSKSGQLFRQSHKAPCRRVPVSHRRRAANARCMAQTIEKRILHKPPSSATAATELEALSKWSVVIPDTVLMQKVEELELKAATVSSGVLGGMLGNPGVSREYQVIPGEKLPLGTFPVCQYS